MSRAHERAYALLAERVRLGTQSRRALYAILLALIASGAWWLALHFSETGAQGDELARLGQQAWALKAHGAAALVTLVAVGAMLATHSRAGWRLRRNRASGTLVVAFLCLLTISGYALYYLVDDQSRPPVSLLHWGLGLAALPLLVAHIVLGRRSRAARRHDAGPIGGQRTPYGHSRH
jgi:hypothetical protein